MSEAERIAKALNGRKSGRGWIARCPCRNHSHGDKNPSLSIADGDDGRLLLKCFKGGEFADVMDALRARRLIETAVSQARGSPFANIVATAARPAPATFSTEETFDVPNAEIAPLRRGRAYNSADYERSHIYQDETGTPTLMVTVERRPDGEKSVMQWGRLADGTWDTGASKGPRIPYRLPDLLSLPTAPVFIPEGEKDVETLEALGHLATTNPGGAGSWHKDLNKYFAGREIFIVPDADDAGEKRVTRLCEELKDVASSIKVVRLPGLEFREKHGEDITDWLGPKHGHTNEEFIELARRAPAYQPPKEDKQSSITLTYFGEIGETALKQWLMKGVIAKGETSSWIAPPGKGKSALLTDIVIHVASGADWRGYRSKERCGVVYFALERADLVKRRLIAHARRDSLADLPIAVAGQVIDLMSPACVAAIVSAIRAAEAKFGLGVGMIVIDTFAKGIAASGGDEDKAKDQNITLANLRRVQEQTGAHVAIIGHTGKDESRGARGSNAHVGDTDLQVQLRGDDIKTAEIIKANDQQEGVLTRFKLETFELGRDEDDDAITTAILSAETFDESATKAKDKDRAKLTANERRALEMLERAVIDAGQPAPASGQFPFGIKVVPLALWRDYCIKGGLTAGDSEGAFRKAFIRAHTGLAEKRRVGIWEELAWLVH
jgi:hypothetical protein